MDFVILQQTDFAITQENILKVKLNDTVVILFLVYKYTCFCNVFALK